MQSWNPNGRSSCTYALSEALRAGPRLKRASEYWDSVELKMLKYMEENDRTYCTKKNSQAMGLRATGCDAW
eukprot:754728-Hanusia_phi.AAC.2